AASQTYSHRARVTVSHLARLQSVLDREIPMCGLMGVRVASAEGDLAEGLAMTMPLERNRNHQQTAFAGSLNALCTIAGWGATWLELRRLEAEGVPVEGAIVIRRSTIKYHEPVTSPLITARCVPPTADARSHFAEMLVEKGQSKFDLQVEIASSDPERPAVVLKGSYVVLPAEEAIGI
ncbi:MAG: YiiD C-terminal domain-containing protein, partial [Planctomycetota bacterium]